MITTSTLTDRYIAQTVRSLPDRQRKDIEAELRGLITDAIEDKLESGADIANAEVQVLTDLGPPIRLAAKYSDRSQHLIGPALFPDYVRVLKVLASTIVPLWFLFFGLVTFVNGSPVLQTLGEALYSTLQTAMSVAFFTTLIFAVVERSSFKSQKTATSWSPSLLPETLDKRAHFRELIGGIGFLALIICVIVFFQTVGTVEGSGGSAIGPIHAELWSSGAFVIALLFALVGITFHLLTYYTGWSVSNAAATLVLDILFAVPAIWLVNSGRLVNREYFEIAGWPAGADVISVGLIVFVIFFSVADAIDGAVKASKKRRTR